MKIPQSRKYTHLDCKSQTEISGPEFQAVSDPLCGMKQTYCAQCEEHFDVDEFAWSDSGESIADYYSRHSKAASEMDLFFCSTTSLLFLAGLGFFVGIMFGAFVYFAGGGGMITIIFTLVFGVVGAVVGALAREKYIAPMIIKRVCDVDDTRSLK